MKIIMKTALLILLLGMISGMGCSSGFENSITPPMVTDERLDSTASDSGRVLWGIWNFTIDPETFEANAEFLRDAQPHLNITQMLIPPSCGDCLKLNVYFFDPVTRILELGITLRNPTLIGGYDVRGIVYANELGHRLVNPDAWTGLWDAPGGENWNPFIAYAKTETNRLFAGEASHTEDFQIYIPQPPMWNSITYAVDASWPQNCWEPYAIDKFTQEMIFDATGSSGNISVDVLDWQGDVSTVTISVPEITGTGTTTLTNQGNNSWGALISNNIGAIVGEYDALIIAESINTGLNKLYDHVTIRVADEQNPFLLTDITIDWMSFFPWDFEVEGDYIYFWGSDELQRLNVNDPFHPSGYVAIDTMEDGIFIENLVVSGEYAYILSESSLKIYDIDPIGSAHLVNECDTVPSSTGIVVKGGYAYVTNGDSLEIIDIDPPASCSSLNTIESPFPIHNEFIVESGYAYVSVENGMGIVDIDPPESMALVKSIPLEGAPRDLALVEGYAYVARTISVGASGGLYVVDVDPPSEASLEKVLLGGNYISGVEVNGNDAFVVDSFEDRLWIIDTSVPGDPEALNFVEVERITKVACAGEAVYALTYAPNLHIFRHDSPNFLVEEHLLWGMSNPMNIRVKDNYIYAADYYGPRFINTDEPDIIGGMSGMLSTPFPTSMDVNTLGDYAYIAHGSDGLWVVDISDMNHPEVVLELPGFIDARAVELAGDYAYVADGSETDGFKIVDITDPPNAFIVSTMPSIVFAMELEIDGDIAYVLRGAGILHLIDISDPLSLSYIKSVSFDMWGYDVALYDGMAYIAGQTALKIVDIDPPEFASEVKSIDTFDESHSVAAMDGYAFITDRQFGVHIIDVDPIETASIIDTLEWLTYSEEVRLSGDKLYVADMYAGLRIYELY